MTGDALRSLGRGIVTANRRMVALERKLLALLLCVLLGFSLGQIVLRYFFSMGFVWIDPVLRICVLWITFTGACLAAEYNRHIRMDLLRHLPNRTLGNRWYETAGLIFFAGVCGVLFHASVNYILMTGAEESVIPGLPDWCLRLIIPYCFFMMGIRALVRVFSLSEQLPGPREIPSQ